MYKQTIIFNKSSSAEYNSVYKYKFPRGIRLKHFRLKNFYVSGLGETTLENIQTQITGNDGDILAIQTEQATQNTNINTNATNVNTNSTNITSIQNVMSTDTERLNAVTSLTTAYTSADTTLNNTLTTALTSKADKSDLAQNVLPNVYYFNSSYGSAGDGSFLKPYSSLSSFADILASTPRKVNVFLSGSFSISSTIQINHNNWDFTILGNNCSISADITKNIFNVNNCDKFKLQNVELNTCKYGLRTYAGSEIVIENCRLIKCGTSGDLDLFNGTYTQSQLQTFWNGGGGTSTLTSGGGLRIKSSAGGFIKISGCYVEHCLRAIRVENCGKGIVNDNIILNSSDNGIYLREAAGVLVSSNEIKNVGTNSLLSIYSNECVFQNNNCIDGWAAGICNYGSQNIDYISNNFNNCNRKLFTGFGASPCDNYAQICFRGNLNVGVNLYIAKIINNCFTHTTTINSNILLFDSGIFSSYTGASKILYFENNKYDIGLVKVMNNFSETSINQETFNINSNSVTDLNDVSNAGSGDIISAAERGLLNSHTNLISNNATAITGKQNTLTFGTVAENSNSKVCYSNEIKTYVDSNSGGVTSKFYNLANDMNYTQIDPSWTHLTWTKNHGLSDGGNMSFRLSASSDIDSGHTIFIHGFQKHTTDNLNSSNGGTIHFQLNTGQTFRTSSFDNPNIINLPPDKCKIQDVDRHTHALTYYEDGGNNYWLVRSLAYKLTDTHINTINALSSSDVVVNHVFGNTENSYIWNSANPTTHLQLESGVKRFNIIYGDQTDFSSVALGIVFRLPVDPPNGCHIKVYNSMYNETRLPNQGNLNNKNITVEFGQFVGVPGTRKLHFQFNSDISLYCSASGGTVYRHFYAAVTPVIVWDIFYNEPEDTWICRNCSS